VTYTTQYLRRRRSLVQFNIYELTIFLSIQSTFFSIIRLAKLEASKFYTIEKMKDTVNRDLETKTCSWLKILNTVNI